MKHYRLEDFIGGWVVGRFEPNIVKSESVEVAVKYYEKGICEPLHVHKIAFEITIIVTGRAKINGKEYSAGDVLYIEPGEPAKFETLEATSTAVIKMPSVPDDKYILEEKND